MWLHLFVTASWAGDLSVDLPVASWEAAALTVRVQGEKRARVHQCASGSKCIVPDVPDDGWRWVQLTTPDEAWVWMLEPGKDNGGVLERYRSEPWHDVLRFVDLDGDPVIIAEGGYGRLGAEDGRFRVDDRTDSVVLTSGIDVPRSAWVFDGRTVVLPVRRLKRAPSHPLHREVPEGSRIRFRTADNDRYSSLQAWFGFWVPVGAWYEEWLDEDGAHRNRVDVAESGKLKLSKQRLDPIPVTWSADSEKLLGDGAVPGGLLTRRVEDEGTQITGSPLLIRTGPGQGVIHPTEQRPVQVTASVEKPHWRRMGLLEAGEDAVELGSNPYAHLGCLALRPVPEGLFVHKVNVRKGKTDVAFEPVQWGWILTRVDGASTAGWSSKDLVFKLHEGNGTRRHQFTFITDEGEQVIETLSSEACR